MPRICGFLLFIKKNKNLNKKVAKNHINMKFIQHLGVEKVTGFFRGYVIFK